jgi:hypothetical protein
MYNESEKAVGARGAGVIGDSSTVSATPLIDQLLAVPAA